MFEWYWIQHYCIEWWFKYEMWGVYSVQCWFSRSFKTKVVLSVVWWLCRGCNHVRGQWDTCLSFLPLRVKGTEKRKTAIAFLWADIPRLSQIVSSENTTSYSDPANVCRILNVYDWLSEINKTKKSLCPCNRWKVYFLLLFCFVFCLFVFFQ